MKQRSANYHGRRHSDGNADISGNIDVSGTLNVDDFNNGDIDVTVTLIKRG